ncbi:hypothetical protein FGO68_gene15690 [Halteria grandinella]|uniref:Tetratricopeptide repeat protein 29 n=1 Tax=Halteria grandinella TaxID=5974 RepID=A0A8J8NVP9_HALGN|nr:hypothetical protein FGO68_gene15690 [Halteria grandinella]
MQRVRQSISKVGGFGKSVFKAGAGVEETNKTPNRIMLKKSNVVFKEKSRQIGGNPDYLTEGSKRLGTGSRGFRSVSYHIDQIKNMRNLKALGEQSSSNNTGGSGSGSGSGGGNKEGSGGSGDIAQLTAIIKPHQMQEDLKKLDKAQFLQRPLLERFETGSTQKAPFFPIKRAQQSALMYNEIFVTPKQRELEKFKRDEVKADEIIGRQQSENAAAIALSPVKKANKEKVILLEDGGEQFMKELKAQKDDLKNSGASIEDEIDIIEVIMNKYNSSTAKGNPKKNKGQTQSIFSQQIQVHSPDGTYYTQIVSHMNPSQGFTPSLPPGAKNMQKFSVHDIIIRAKSGLSSGDAQREAHTAYYLAKANEDQENFKASLSFYKRFFFLARILDDPIGSSIALNRIGVIYFRMKKIAKSLYFHMKHSKSSDTDNVFVSYYNTGICHRLLGDYQKAYWYFNKAIEWAQFTEDKDNECLCHGQLGICSFLGKATITAKNQVEASVSFQKCLDLSTSSKNHPRVSLDCLLCLAFISFDKQDWRLAKDLFDKAYFKSKNLGENVIAEACLCNSGIASGNLVLNSQKSMIDQFYRTATTGFGAKAQPFQGMGGAGAMTIPKRDTSQSDDNHSGYEEEEEEEEDDSGDDKRKVAAKNQKIAWH